MQRVIRAAIMMVIILAARPGNAASAINPDLADALKQANGAGKQLLVDFYGDWCPWCVKMDQTIADPGVKGALDKSFYYYKLDVGHFDQHQGCLTQYGITGIPCLIVFKADGSVKSTCGGYEDADTFKTFLASAREQVQSIHPDLADALDTANKSGKTLLVDFYGDWCPWCVKMDQTIADPGVKDMLDKGFYYYKLDVGRFDKHVECLTQYGINGIPHLIAFKGDGSVMASCNGYEGVDDFKAFLKSALASARMRGNYLATYRLEALTGASDPILQATQNAAKDNRALIVYFYTEGTDAHASIEDAITGVANNRIAGRFALLSVDFAPNKSLSTQYGCGAAPFLIVFKETGGVSSFFQKAMTSADLTSAMQEALK